MKYCKICNQNVTPVKKFSIGWFLFDLLTVVGGGIYILYYLFFKKKVCPMCNTNQLEDMHDNISDNDSPTISDNSLSGKIDKWATDAENNKLRAKIKLAESGKGYADAKLKLEEARQAGRDQALAKLKKEQKKLSN